MADLNVTTYICPHFVCGIEATQDPEEGWASTQTADGIVTTAIMPASMGKEPSFVYARLGREQIPLTRCCPEGQQSPIIQAGYIPRFCADPGASLSLKLEVNERGQLLYCGVRYEAPRDCDWIAAAVFGEHFGLLEQSWPAQRSGPIPLGGGKEGVLNIIGNQYNQNPYFVPGERVSLVWYYTSAPGGYEVATAYFATKCFTGGWLIGMSSEPNDPDNTYTVCIEGKDYPGLKSSDFFPYALGDWVYIFREPDAAKGCDEDYEEDIQSILDGPPRATPNIELSVPEFSGNGLLVPNLFHGVGAIFY